MLTTAWLLLVCAGGIPMQVGIDTHDDLLLFLGFVVFCLSGVPLLLAFPVLLFNRPKPFVPPWLRDRHGILGESREARRARR